MRKIEPEFITGMGYIGASPGVLYRMGGAGEQTVVTGNPALLEGVKGNRFTFLTLHGISTQGSTTGANILKDTYLSLCKGGVDLFTANGLFTANSNYEKNVEFNLLFTEGSIFADSIKDEETYYIAFRPIGFTPVYRFQLSLKNGAHETIATSVGAIVASVSGAVLKKTARIQLYFFNVSGAIPIISGSRFQMIFSKKPDCIYEPYTGGKPSPSPEYPQEIKSAGQSGEIGVTVTGTNLLPFEVGQKGDEFEAFADGVQVDVDRKTDIYAVGRNNGNVESGYDEFALMTAGKYYIYSGTQDVYLYVVVWRKGKNVVLGYSVGTDAEQIEIMDGDKFRIFLRTTAAFKGKVKAMITRTPMNATSYEPYKPAQTLIIPTPNGLPGIPVSSDGNYTDADGRQWVCDEVDFKKGVYVQRIGKRTITSKDVFHKSGMSTDDVNYFSLGNFSLHIGTIGEKDVLMSNCFVAGINHGFGAWGKIFLSSAFDGKVYFSVEAQKYPDEETFKQWAVENGLMFLYQLVDIIETPLAAEELSAYKTLHTYSPTTIVANDAGAGMSVGYKRRK
ncbi:MAG: hypothetical protein ACLS41_01680 [Gallintestinimicrobium sp.]|uniref:hypothetical protein n=2 Tax=Gallintestinimicrobium sp. TaxID=2981655 RepID=UPI003993A101